MVQWQCSISKKGLSQLEIFNLLPYRQHGNFSIQLHAVDFNWMYVYTTVGIPIETKIIYLLNFLYIAIIMR